MKTKLICAILAIVMISSMILVPQTLAFSYGNPAKATDTLEEYFGPRANRIVIPLYADQISEYTAGLEAGKIDLTDWPLDDVHYAAYTTAPLNNSIAVFKYGPEFGMREFDMDVNNNTYLDYPGPLITLNPRMKASDNFVTGNPFAELSLRQAVAYVTDRNDYVTHIGPNTNIAVYTMLGANSLGLSPWGKYTDFDITPGGARADLTYAFSLASATAVLNGAGVWGVVGGFRGYKGHPFTIDIYARIDDPYRDYAGTRLGIQLTALGFNVVVHHVDINAARAQVMASKDFSIYTGGWSLSSTPDFIYLWNYPLAYYHPGRPPNYGGINDATYNTDSYNVMVANTQADAEFYSIDAQIEMASQVLMIPLWIAAGGKAVSRTYTGGNNGVATSPDDGQNAYRGKYWDGFAVIAGFGTDNGQSFLNMHPDGYDWGSGNMTIFYGFKTTQLNQMNPVYTEFLWDNTVIDVCGYDSLVTRNPLNLAEFDNWAAKNFVATTYNNPVLGTCTKVVYTLRNDYFFQDGQPVTAADAYFTFVELKNDLAARGLAPPWWVSNVLDILSFTELDPYNFEVLYDVKSMFAIGWAGGNRILPEHIWKPIIVSGDPTTFAPDPNMIENGPWRLASYTSGSSVVLVANTPGSVNTCNMQGVTGAVPITSTQGYFRYLPIEVDPVVTSPSYLAYMTHLPDDSNGTAVTFTTTYMNLFADRDITVHSTVSVNGTPVTIPTPDWILGHNGVYGVSGTATGFDMHGIFVGGMLDVSWWIWDNTFLNYYEYMWFVGNTTIQLTWNTANIGTPLSSYTTYYVGIHDTFTFSGIAQLGANIPLNTRHGFDITWEMFSIPQDIAGTNWYDAVTKVIDPTTMLPALSFLAANPYKAELAAPDGKVDGKDIATAAKAFGTVPGDTRWSTISDINHDYKVDGKDIAQIAKKFGYYAH
ncbi:MAG: ABC transporter substrate-binding protein [Candidatus Bathyarchaeia archaeon]